MHDPLWTFIDEPTSNTNNTSWFTIIFEIFLCVLCPYLIIPFWYIRSKCENNGIKPQNIVTVLYSIAFILVVVLSPIVTIIHLVTYGFIETFQEFGGLLAITLSEIIFALIYLWKTQIKKKLNLEKSDKTVFWNTHQGLFPIFTLSFCVLFFVLILSDVNQFFAFMILIFGTYGVVKGFLK